MTVKQDTINHIIDIEGGYVNDPHDSGGETNFGITRAVAREYGYSGSMESMPRSVAFNIYSSLYWDSMRLDDVVVLSPSIARELADTAVNMGVSRAVLFFQRSLNVLNNRGSYYEDIDCDGALGSGTLKALGDLIAYRGQDGKMVMLSMLNSLQASFYIELAERREKDERFIFGWFKNRVIMKGVGS